MSAGPIISRGSSAYPLICDVRDTIVAFDGEVGVGGLQAFGHTQLEAHVLWRFEKNCFAFQRLNGAVLL